MKNLPFFAWILIVLVVGCVGILIYSQTAPEKFPNPRNVWDFVNEFRQDTELRYQILAEKQLQEIQPGPYRVTQERLENLFLPNPVARYVIRIRPTLLLTDLNPWLGDGLDVALLDREPQNTVGELQIVAIRRVKVKDE